MARALTWAVFLGAGCGIVYLCLLILRPFSHVIAWSVVLAIVCYPLQQRLVRKTGRVALSAFITSVLAVFAVVIPLMVIVGVALKQGLLIGYSMRDAVHSSDRWLARMWVALAPFATRVGMDQHTIGVWLRQHTMSFASGLIGTMTTSMLVIVALFLMLRDGPRIAGALPDLLPFERTRSEVLLQRIRDVVQASVNGVVVIALIDGAAYGTTFWLLGVPAAALWGMVTVFASVVPVVGAFSVWGSVAAYLTVHGQWPRALVLGATACLVTGFDHILRPRLLAGRVGLSELPMFFALLGGVTAFGALGVVLGPVAFATCAALVDTLREPGISGGVTPSRPTEVTHAL
jgi:predicted PurR-regulated permease PerM